MIIQSTNVWVGTVFSPLQIEIIDDTITNIYPYNTHPVTHDYGNYKILPGFIDIHVHGGYGVDTNDADEAGLRHLQKNLAKEGLTGFYPTTITQSEEVLTRALKNVASVYEQQDLGAEILGIHFEGPYLDMTFKGAQPPECIAKADVEQFQRYQKAANNLIKLITMATEHDENYTLTKYLTKTGVRVSQGHSGATFEQALLGIAHGATGMTHVYNGMSRFNHRDLNMVGAALRCRDIYGEIIVDGNHMSFDAVNIYMTSKGKDRPILITDALLGKGQPVGSRYLFGKHPIEIQEDGSAILLDSEVKTLAGSTLQYNVGVHNILHKVNLDWEAAIKASSTNAATYLGIDDKYGHIRSGHKASLTVVDDMVNVIATITLGKIVYQAD